MVFYYSACVILLATQLGLIACQDYKCENTTYELSCPKGDVINITDAFYGRLNSTACSPNGNNTEPCSLPAAKSILMSKCDGDNNCTIYVNSTDFEDPCPGISKYLTVNYTCVNASNQEKGCGRLEHRVKYGCDCNYKCPGFNCSNICREFECVCDSGYLKDPKTNRCVRSEFCPQPGNNTNEIFSFCANCQPTCRFPYRHRFPFGVNCEPGYACIKGFVRDNLNNCIPINNCYNSYYQWGRGWP